jgi:hypothetical protein
VAADTGAAVRKERTSGPCAADLQCGAGFVVNTSRGLARASICGMNIVEARRVDSGATNAKRDIAPPVHGVFSSGLTLGFKWSAKMSLVECCKETKFVHSNLKVYPVSYLQALHCFPNWVPTTFRISRYMMSVLTTPHLKYREIFPFAS